MAPGAIEIQAETVSTSPGSLSITPPSSDPVPFGSEDGWLYLPSCKRFDLSRGATTKLVIDADDGVRHHRGCIIDPAKTVLVIIDMQNYFIHPKIRDHPYGIEAVKPTLRVIQRCRSLNIPIAWLNWGITDHDLKIMPPAVLRGFCRTRAAVLGHGWHVGLGSELPDDQGRVLWKGSWNAQIYDPLLAVAEKEDLYFDKNRPSGMWSVDEPLHRYLRESERKTILFAGVNTDQCVLGTLTDAYSNGFDCILLGDCAGTATTIPNTKELCDYNIATNYGFVATSEDFCSGELIEENEKDGKKLVNRMRNVSVDDKMFELDA